MKYERVTFTADNKTLRVILRIVGESARMLSGYEVDRDGEEIVPRGFERRLRVIDKTLIRKRVPMKMNNFYGTLEVDK